MLWLIDCHGHRYLQDLARRYSSPSLWGLLGELEELRLVERCSSADRAGLPKTEWQSPFSADDKRRFEQDLQSASHSVLKGKSYVPEHRAKRPPLEKERAQTTVLIVEDDPDQLALADLRVSMAGYQVWVAESAKALHDTLTTKGAPDVVVLDVMLPDGDGFALLGELRSNPDYANLPVILLTAKSNLDDIIAGLRLGADGYLTKPYAKAMLEEMLKLVLEQPSVTTR